jgi:DNA mismatch repair protein MutL
VADSAPQKPAYQPLRPIEKPVGSAFGKPPASVTEQEKAVAKPASEKAAVKPAESPVREIPVQPEPPKQERPFVPAIPAVQQSLELPEQQTIEEPKEAPWRIVGEVLHTYIICEDADGCVWLIDKHAAHERVNFDRLKAAQEPPMRQTLLAPVAAELTKEDGELLLENLELLEQFGFACEDFGDGAVLVREVPADIDAADTVSTLEEFAENLRNGRSLAEKRENLLHTMACKAAIKGGWVSDRKELEVLVEKVQAGEVRFCPHGRPVAVKLTKYELEKMFKRA